MQKIYLTVVALFMSVAPCLASANIDEFKEKDPLGVSMAIISMGVVFSALVILFLCFKWSGKLLNKHLGTHSEHGHDHASANAATAPKMKVTEANGNAVPATDEVYAAIGMALFLAEGGMHDEESSVLTLEHHNASWLGRGNNHKQEPLRKF